ncbi:MAG: bifunctional riboflavin kinase/FAD synthetase [Desulfobacteraceae bacterium]|nr:MAG: bifunctional riboflavin kinase/FAD synthetase [Desulfobacteraceae bacterium]
MSVIFSLDEIKRPFKNPVLTIGNFDGVHRGHLGLFNKVKERAKAIGGQSIVMTFEPHPAKVMRPGNGPLLITPTDQKLELMEQAGMDAVICVPFNRAFAAVSAEDFVKKILVGKIGIKEMVVGYDYTFGYQRQGNLELLRKMGHELGFLVHVIGPIEIDHTPVSSTSIRQLVQAGQIKAAKDQLGRDFQISGKVVPGQGRGKKLLGFPTANLSWTDGLYPKPGVYAVRVLLEGRTYYGVTNIGYNPTFENQVLTIETHIFDFAVNIVDKTIKLEFVERIRDEKNFGNPGELKDQIALDIDRAKEILGIKEAKMFFRSGKG